MQDELGEWVSNTARSLALVLILFVVIAVGSVVFSSCAAIGAGVGTGIGLATGQPEVALVTGPAGAWIGDKFEQGKREAARADKAEAALERSRQDAADTRATLLANKAIAEHNQTLPAGEKPTPLYGAPQSGKPNTAPKSWLDVSVWKRLFGGGG